MIPLCQQEAFDFLNHLAQRNGGERVDTHISAVFLWQDKAYKMKRAVKFSFLDFSSLEKRKIFCTTEIDINKKISPLLYHGLAALTREADGSLQIDGKGQPVEWLVAMQRFDKQQTFDKLPLTKDLCQQLAIQIAQFHSSAEIIPDINGVSTIKNTIDNNLLAFRALDENIVDNKQIDFLITEQNYYLNNIQDTLKLRSDNGYIRSCHGDLHLRNICLFNDKPTMFDAIEFDSNLSNIDVLYDLAFVLMDLDCRLHSNLGNILLNHYLAFREDWQNLNILPLFLSLRASIRSHVEGACVASFDAPEAKATACQKARNYLEKAISYLNPNIPRLVAIGGFSGAGKSKLGQGIAPDLGLYPGAIVLRTDILRKQIMGVPPLNKLPPEAYNLEMNSKTYARLYELTAHLLGQGISVIADAVFARPEERKMIETIARDLKIPFQGFWLQAHPEIMAARIKSRINNPSDATVEVLEQQLGYKIDQMNWPIIDSSGPKGETLKKAREIIKI